MRDDHSSASKVAPKASDSSDAIPPTQRVPVGRLPSVPTKGPDKPMARSSSHTLVGVGTSDALERRLIELLGRLDEGLTLRTDEWGELRRLVRELNLKRYLPDTAKQGKRPDSVAAAAAWIHWTLANHVRLGDPLGHLRKAAKHFDRDADYRDEAIRAYEELVTRDPKDKGARAALEIRYANAQRFDDLALLLEEELVMVPRPSPSLERRIHSRLIPIYLETLHDKGKAWQHIAALLAMDPSHGEARAAAEQLLEDETWGAEVGETLRRTYERSEDHVASARLLEWEAQRDTSSERQGELLLRLAHVRATKLGDPKGHLSALCTAFELQPTATEVYQNILEASRAMGHLRETSAWLVRLAGNESHAPTPLAPQWLLDAGRLALEAGDEPNARSCFEAVLRHPEADTTAALTAGNELVRLLEGSEAFRSIVEALEQVSAWEANPEARTVADLRLAVLYTTILRNPQRAILVWERLLQTEAWSQALEALGPLYEELQRTPDYAQLLERTAERAVSPEQTVICLVKAATLWDKTGDPRRADALWKRMTMVARAGKTAQPKAPASFAGNESALRRRAG